MNIYRKTTLKYTLQSHSKKELCLLNQNGKNHDFNYMFGEINTRYRQIPTVTTM